MSQECELLVQCAKTPLHDGVRTLPRRFLGSVFPPTEWRAALAQLRRNKAVPAPATSVLVHEWQLHAEEVAPILADVAIGSLSVALRRCLSEAQLAWLPKQGKSPPTPCNLRSIGLMTPDTKAFLLIIKKHASLCITQVLHDMSQYA